ncbi:hypothetical protein CN140_01790 [Sinorhizobium meliloti]|uniref:hypothetical protein n=1 Tax=Rhizobium meliloti TaxID=382 RepID=UPI000FD8F44C|nr:hypothetical protein [Sinorhizobium meliloti]RVL87689.1 hypothetical protein CN140_01790 [Sinorhizobium meliloti]
MIRLYLLAGVVILGGMGVGYWHYNSILDDRQALSEALAASKAANDLAIQAADNNAARAREIEATYKTQIAALEVLATETAVNEALSRAFTDDIATADDIEIPDTLAKPFLRRFGGGR